ncbi:MAG: 30S ribosomal protein S6 [Clostridia bacterium]|nr:30S ribosomal protein S6 [Clostridia bacterium]
MNKYEALYIIDKDVSEESRQAVIDRLSNVVTSSGGEVENVDKWGIRKYAYPINFKNEGFYVLMNFTSAPEVPAEIERLVRIMDETVRIMIIRR